MLPDLVVAEGVVWKRILEEVLEESHVLHGEKGYLVFRLDVTNSRYQLSRAHSHYAQVDFADLVYYLWCHRIFTLQFPLYTMTTGRTSLLTLGCRTGQLKLPRWKGISVSDVTTLIRLFLQLKQPLRDLKWPLLSSFFFCTEGLVTTSKGAIAMGLRGTMACCGELDRVADDDDSPAEFSLPR